MREVQKLMVTVVDSDWFADFDLFCYFLSISSLVMIIVIRVDSSQINAIIIKVSNFRVCTILKGKRTASTYPLEDPTKMVIAWSWSWTHVPSMYLYHAKSTSQGINFRSFARIRSNFFNNLNVCWHPMENNLLIFSDNPTPLSSLSQLGLPFKGHNDLHFGPKRFQWKGNFSKCPL